MKEALETCCVPDLGTLRDAMLALERGNVQIALVLDSERRLIGTLTDGDIRRAILAGAALDASLRPHVQRRYVSVSPTDDRARVLDLMQARMVNQVPIVDAERRLLGLHLMSEMLGAVERPNWAVVMAGGRGSRLRPLTEYVPKPMLTVAGRPILERLVLHLVGFGVRRIFLAVNYRREMIEDYFGDGHAFGCSIDYLREETPLGTGGPLSLLPETPTHPLLVMNGDLVTQFDVHRLLEFHNEHGFAATLAVHRHDYTVPFGVARLDGTSLTGIDEKPTVTWSVNAGIYVLEPALQQRVPAGIEYPLPAVLEEAIGRGERVGGYLLEGEWSDIGRSDELQRARGTGSR